MQWVFGYQNICTRIERVHMIFLYCSVIPTCDKHDQKQWNYPKSENKRGNISLLTAIVFCTDLKLSTQKDAPILLWLLSAKVQKCNEESIDKCIARIMHIQFTRILYKFKREVRSIPYRISSVWVPAGVLAILGDIHTYIQWGLQHYTLFQFLVLYK